jgi:transcriptional regulator with XRE-family HTH domain
MGTFGQNVVKIRVDKRMKQKDLQEKSGLSQRYLSAVENDKVDPRPARRTRPCAVATRSAMDTPDPDRFILLERAQQLHDSTLRRHGELLDAHETRLAALHELLQQQLALQASVQDPAVQLVRRQGQQDALFAHLATRQDQHEALLASVAQTLAAIKDLLERRNGRP